MINTNALIKLYYGEMIRNFYENDPERYQLDETFEAILDVLTEAEYQGFDALEDEDFALLYPIDRHEETEQTIKAGIESLLEKNSLPVPDAMEIIILGGDNVSDWVEYLVPDADADVVQAIVENDSYYLQNPDRIEEVTKDDFIGRFRSEREFAEFLASDDPKIRELDEDIFDALDLVKYYSDTIQYETWHDGELWFWNR